MNLDLTPEQEAFAAEARAWLAENVPQTPLPSMDTEAGFAAHREWEATLAAGRWSVVSWPAQYGGRDVGITEWVLFEEEYYRAGAPPASRRTASRSSRRSCSSTAPPSSTSGSSVR